MRSSRDRSRQRIMSVDKAETILNHINYIAKSFIFQQWNVDMRFGGMELNTLHTGKAAQPLVLTRACRLIHACA